MQYLRVLICCFSLLLPRLATACDLALVLAVDVSGSVDETEYRIQMDGLAEGLRDGIVSEALVRAEAQILLIQWSGTRRQEISIPWTALQTFEDVEALAQRVELTPRPWRNFSTALGEALELASLQFDQVAQCQRRVIDLSGDGFSNEGIAPRALHPELGAKGITVNAIAIEQSEPELTAYFYENVIRGEGAFVETAANFRDYPQKIRRKLIREVAEKTADFLPPFSEPAPDLQEFAGRGADSAKVFQ